MQIRKDDIRKRILVAARGEFCRKGMKRTSIKDIASVAGVAVGNIYNYFSSKNDIFVAICSPLLKALDDFLILENGEENQTIELFSVDSYQHSMINHFMQIVKEYRPEFRLLLFESSGTTLEDYFQQYAKKQALIGDRYVASMKEKYPYINSDISPYFIELSCFTWFAAMRILVQNEDMSREDMQKFVTDYILYGTAGWKKLLGV
ncbi:MAG: TetR/AcrR family transcriptional regulator [Prevotella sp.]|uniref:TetR/AcrR family transcriptional regulator n=1 Tax=Prevotella sp. TaxID=59823 RepID=UPI002A29B1FD|nr:TetR/AcrR family transcriptional regulator [Prevotella sp.]MDD7317723.1 TetR/AcrR family transcriptional regulator [Prevotellaceae bacterium]MDY4020638.1 TetR/AcrR family transcriptional regulator [Prevotella sp.]